MKPIVVALAGNPNVGKTTVLNQIAGSNLKVGNWAGVTIEKKEAFLTHGDFELHFVDLPGIYTFEHITEAEEVAVKFLSGEEVDVVLNIIDSTNLTRNLSLTTEILEFERPTVLALNMIDEAQSKGIHINKDKLKELLGTQAVETNGRTGSGIDLLIDKVVEAYSGKRVSKAPVYHSEIEGQLEQIYPTLHNPNNNKHAAIKLLSSEEGYSEVKGKLEKYFGKEFSEIINDERWGFANGLSKQILKVDKTDSRELTEKLDSFLLHPYLGILIYIFLIYMVFKISFDFSAPYMDWIDGFLNNFISPVTTMALSKVNAPLWLMRFSSEAVIGGIGFVLTFVPLIATIYFFISILEMSGYLPRIAFLMDRFLHKIGLHGNMITPLLLGFGCNVPAIIATKNLRSQSDKMLVIMMIPFMSCPARLVVFAFFAITFFDYPAVVIAGLYILGIVVAVLTALLFKRSMFKGKTGHFVLELPPYRMPSFRTLFLIVFAHVKSFLLRAGTAIFIVSVVVWFLLNMPPNQKDSGESIAAHIGKAITPLFSPIGLDDWRAPTSLIPAFLAREIALSTMAIIYRATDGDDSFAQDHAGSYPVGKELKKQVVGLGTAVKDSFISLFSIMPQVFQVDSAGGQADTTRAKIKQSFTTLSAMSFMILLLIYNSCVATVSIMIREIGRKYALSYLAYSFVVAWLLAFVVFQLGTLFT